MSKHPHHAMHEHSLAAHRAECFEMSKRAIAVYSAYVHRGPMSDREVLQALYPESDNGNLVKPRISELIHNGWAVECDSKIDPHTGKTVRIVRALTDQEHAELVAREKQSAGQVEMAFA